MFELRTYKFVGRYKGTHNETYRFETIEQAREKRKVIIKLMNDFGCFDKTLYPTIFEYKRGQISGEYGYYYIEG